MTQFYTSPHYTQGRTGSNPQNLQSQMDSSEFAPEIESGQILPWESELPEPSEIGKKVLVIDPHSDDGVYSAGGTLIQLAKAGYQITNLTVFSKGGKMEEVRKQENRFVYAEILSGQIDFADFLDAPERGITDLYSAQIGNELRTFLQIRRHLAEVIDQVKPELILGPLGVGLHIDHLLVNMALINLWEQDPTFRLWLYEDYPYCNETSRYQYIKVLTDLRNQVRIVSQYQEISAELEDKISLQMVYRSQHDFKRSELADTLTKLGMAIGMEGEFAGESLNGRYYERIWCVQQ